MSLVSFLDGFPKHIKLKVHYIFYIFKEYKEHKEDRFEFF